jgi:hypothetical protein
MLKRRIQKVAKTLQNLFKSGKNTKKWIVCKECDTVEVEVAHDIAAVTCGYCVQRQVAPPANIKPKSEGGKFPRGWALKQRYVHTDGRIFIKGKDTGEIEAATPPKPKKDKKATVKKKKSPKRKK